MPPGQEKTAAYKVASASTYPDLSIFCDPESLRYNLGQPFVHDGWKYATDGKILVRVPAKKDEKDTPERNEHGTRVIPRAWELFDKSDSDRCTLEWSDFLAEVKATAMEIECGDCYGRKLLQIECEQCNGDGRVCPENSGKSRPCKHCGKSRPCKHCGGKGNVNNPDGKPCPACFGVGKVWEPTIATGTDVKLAGGYIVKVSTLRNVRYCGAGNGYTVKGVYYNHSQIAFVFAADRAGRKIGQGLLMGLARGGE